MNYKHIIAAVFIMGLTWTQAAAESVVMTSYLPSPSGIYMNLTVTSNTYLARDGGSVVIGSAVPLSGAKLDVNGGIRPGSIGVSIGGACSPEGALGYDATTSAPVFCNHSGIWNGMMKDNRSFVAWNSNSCPTGFNQIYSGLIFTSAIHDSGSDGSDQVCTVGTARGRYRVNDTFTGYQCDDPANCSVCAKPSANFCFTYWGGATCPSGFSTARTGYMAQSAWNSGGTSGKFTCWEGPQHGGIYVLNTTKTGYNWIKGDACAECCSN